MGFCKPLNLSTSTVWCCIYVSPAQSHLTLWDPMDCSLSGSSVHGILQARKLEWVAISFSRGSSRPRDQIHVSHIAGRTLYHLSHQGIPICKVHHEKCWTGWITSWNEGRNINNLRYADDATLIEESKEELKCLFMRMKEWKAGLKLDIQKSKIMASNPIISWQKDGGKMETFLGLQNHWGQWLQPWN